MNNLGCDEERFRKEIFEDKVYDLELPSYAVVVDIGAHVGLFSEFISPKAGHVYAIEPAQDNFDRLEARIKLLPLSNVTAYKYAVTNECGSGTIANQTTDGGWYLGSATDSTKYSESVETITLNEFMKQNCLEHIDLLKIDCEGCEQKVFGPEFPFEKIDAIVGEQHNMDVKPLLELAGFKYQNTGIGNTFRAWRDEQR